MKRSTKAVLLSALVFPGAGQLFLKKYMAGVLLVGAAFSATCYLVLTAVRRALEIVEKIQRADVQPDLRTLAELVAGQSTGADAQLLDIATAALLGCWLIGIVHAFLAGRALDKRP